MGLGVESPAGVRGQSPGGRKSPAVGSGAKPPPEAESSVAFEAPVKKPNLTLVTDSFLQLIGL